jgi:hypothetical protein
LQLAAFAVGCGKSTSYDMAAAHGKVTIDGKPLTAAKVMFAPAASQEGKGIDSGKPAFGTLGNDGAFVLGTYSDADGAITGPHAVTIIAFGDLPAAPPAGAILPSFRRMMVPRQFKIESGKDNEISIELTNQDVAKYSQK